MPWFQCLSAVGPWGHLLPRQASVSPFVNKCLHSRVVTRGREIFGEEHPAGDGNQVSQHVGNHGSQRVRRAMPEPPRPRALCLSAKRRCACVPFSTRRTHTHRVTVPGSLGTVLEIEECSGMDEVPGVAPRRPGQGKSPGWGRGRGCVSEMRVDGERLQNRSQEGKRL